MAHAIVPVYLGFEDEPIPERNVTLLNYSVNKIGGLPDWPPHDKIQFSTKCPQCGLHRLLVVQCYAPLESSQYHRTLYVFACVSPNCWNVSDGWACVRSQLLDESNSTTACASVSVDMPIETNMTWCSGADEWDENDNGDRANGNIVNIDNQVQHNNAMHRNSDEDDDSSSIDVDTVEQALVELHVDACNANMSPVQGAVGAAGPVPAAELEGADEPGLVTVDTPTTPTAPRTDLHALLNQTAELPVDLRKRLALVQGQFVPKYVYVEQETTHKRYSSVDHRVDELLNKYRRENGDGAIAVGNDLDSPGGGDEETYEEARPMHGDKLLHEFLVRLRENPLQILRYSRGAPPLLGAPAPPAPPCRRCGARTRCELQLTPNLSSALSVRGFHLAHLQLLSVLVYSCAESCWREGDTAALETVVFQQEIL